MERPTVTYDLIYQVYQKERQSALLSSIHRDFYEDVAKLIKELRMEYETENKKNPTSAKTMLLHDELKKTRMLILEIYDYRIRKITLLALTSASEGSVTTKHLVERELTIFENLSNILKNGFDEIVMVEQGRFDITQEPDEAGRSRKEKVEKGPSDVVEDEGVEDVCEKELVPKTTAKARTTEKGDQKKKLVAVQILEDLPKFMGEGGEVYVLKKKDFASLPATMAKRLEKEGKARIMPS